MQQYTYAIALRIWHPTIDPSAITVALGVEPARSMMAGQARQTPKGTPLEGTYRESYWSASPLREGWTPSSDDQAEDAMAELLALLKPHADYLLALRRTGGRLLIQISSHSRRNYALEIPPEMLTDCASLGVGFAHDVYPYP
jgi:hypothetical protein